MNAHPNFLCCTLTGASDDVDPRDLAALSAKYPFVEWGILWSFAKERRGKRYPSSDWLERFVEVSNATGMATALHLAGTAVDSFAEPASDHPSLGMIPYFDRVQLNFSQQARPKNLPAIQRMMSVLRKPVITPHNAGNLAVTAGLQHHQHQVLFDASGGRGVLSDEIPRPVPGKRACGYAGGLGPDNIADRLPLYADAAGSAIWWIDMEQRLRTSADEFDLSAVERVLSVVSQWLGQGLVRAADVHTSRVRVAMESEAENSASRFALARFRATGRDVPDLALAGIDNSLEPGTAGRVYAGNYFIEGTSAAGWSLTIGNYTRSGSLDDLEADLHDYVRSETV